MLITPYPFLRVLLPLLSGIICACFSNTIINEITLLVYSLLFVLLLLVLHYYEVKKPNYIGSFQYIFILGIFLLGYLLMENKQEKVFSKSPTNQYILTIIDNPELKNKTIKITGKLSSIVDGRKHDEYLALFYIRKNEDAIKLQLNDKILIQKKLEKIKPGTMIGDFDYSSYLLNKGFHVNAFLSPKDWVFLCHQQIFSLVSLARKYNQHLQNFMETKFENVHTRSFLMAMLIGTRTHMDDEIKNAFAITGTTHILAVSGMHVGLIYLLFYTLFIRWNKRNKYQYITLHIVSIIVLWFYAFITGMQASVIRATVMFSFIILSKILDRNSSIYNSIYASAVCILAVNPLLILDLGFQLSYAAVLGIVYFQPLIYESFISRYQPIDALWKMTSVTLAAQLMTLPLLFYYFHTFPTYFLIANILILPISTAIVYLGIAYLTINIGLAGSFIHWCISILVFGSEQIALTLSKLPYSSIYVSFQCYDMIGLFTLLFIASKWGKIEKYRVQFLLSLLSGWFLAGGIHSLTIP